MIYCKTCGLLLPAGVTTCPECGTPIPPQPTAPARPVYTPPPAAPASDSLGTGGNLAMLLVFLVPVVGFIMMLVWSFGGTSNKAREALARAYLIRTLIAVMLITVLVVIGALLFSTAVSYSYYLY